MQKIKELYLSDGIDDCYGALSKEPAVPVCLHIRQGQADVCVIFHKQEKKFTFFMQITLKNKVTMV
ncbi:MAG: hypothetical protein ACLUDP_16890 [[Clostridium] innocuum]